VFPFSGQKKEISVSLKCGKLFQYNMAVLHCMNETVSLMLYHIAL
jgi:hypothetical protein